jgi:threonine/homoserine/homoserine lactone efflux protein
MSDIAGPILALTLTSAAVMGSPGPSTVSATAVGASFGIKRSLPYAAGLIAGAVAVLLAVALGVVAVIFAIPYGSTLLGTISAAYILYLAYKIATAPPLDKGANAMAAPSFAGGFLLAIANPKAYLAIAAVFAGTVVIGTDHRLDALVKVALLTAMIVIIHLFWLIAGASLSRILHDPKSSRAINLILALALIVTTFIAFVK